VEADAAGRGIEAGEVDDIVGKVGEGGLRAGCTVYGADSGGNRDQELLAKGSPEGFLRASPNGRVYREEIE
jgi:hypothetical protein